MAFNPFDVFRRNQRTLFAIITIFTMFAFVLSFGQGDFFSWFPQWLGSQRSYGEVVAEVGGRAVKTSELERVNRNRILANQYMVEAAHRARGNLAKYLGDGLPRVSPENRQKVERAVQVHNLLSSRQGLDPRMLQFLDQFLRETAGQLAGVAGAAGRPDDKDLAESAQYLLGLDVQLMNSPAGLYFLNQPNASNKDKMDFLLWLRKADALGVTLTPDDVTGLAADEFKRQITPEQLVELREEFRRTRPQFYAPDLFERALADEFRVRAAQTAALGPNLTRPTAGGPSFTSPYDAFQFYQDQTAAARFGVVTVPVENYLAKVPARPAEGELQELFKKYRNTEPSPDSPKPGLKEPRRVKVGWAEGRGDEPFYKTAAAAAVPQLEAHARLMAALTPATAGPAGALLAAALGRADDLLFQAAYGKYRDDFRTELADSWFAVPVSVFLAGDRVRPVEASVLRPQTIAAAAAAVAGSLATGGPWAAAPLAAEQWAARADKAGRVRALAPLLAPAFSLGDLLGAAATVAARLPRPLPLTAVRPALAEGVRDEWAGRIAEADLKRFADELAKLGAKATDDKGQAAARAFAAKFVGERGLLAGESAALRDQYAIGEDPGLLPLKIRAEMADPFHNPAATDPFRFGRAFFFDPSPRGGSPTPSKGLFKPQPYPADRPAGKPSRIDPLILTWRTAEADAVAPKTLSAPGAREKTEAVWRRLKARELARQAADELAKSCGTLGTGAAEVGRALIGKRAEFADTFPAGPDRDRVKYFELDGVAPLAVGPGVLPGRQPVQPFEVAPSDYIPFPGPKMTDQLLAARDKPVGTAVVLTDKPEDRFYVAVLEARDERSADRFGQDVYAPRLPTELAGAVGQREQEELRKQARELAVGLLKAEFHYAKENEAVMSRKGDAGDE